MKIIGIGIDLVENKRFKLLLKNKKFLDRIFTKNEIMISKKKNNKTNPHHIENKSNLIYRRISNFHN